MVMAILGLVLGVAGLLVSWLTVGLYGWIGLILGVAGLVLAILGKKENKGLGIAGLVVSIVAIVISLLMWIACAATTAALEDAGWEVVDDAEEIVDDYEELGEDIIEGLEDAGVENAG